MAPTSKQVRFHFDTMTKSGLKGICKKFERLTIKVAEVESSNRPKRESGCLLKDAVFVIEDGQKLLVRVKSDGTVFQVRLNNKVLPIRAVDNVDKAIAEIVDFIHDNAKAYARAKIQRERRKKMHIAPPAVTTSRREKIAKARGVLEELDIANNALAEQEKETRDMVAEKKSQLDAVNKELEQETAATAVLEQAVKDLEKAA